MLISKDRADVSGLAAKLGPDGATLRQGSANHGAAIAGLRVAAWLTGRAGDETKISREIAAT